MGTNFYIDKKGEQHIGKRSSAGVYCFDCKATLCAGGEQNIHRGVRMSKGKAEWYSLCISCGEKPNPESLSVSSGGVELGFNENPNENRSGVRTCCSFTWAMKPEDFFMGQSVNVWDEYGREFPFDEFCTMLSNLCPVRFYDSIGSEFS